MNTIIELLLKAIFGNGTIEGLISSLYYNGATAPDGGATVAELITTIADAVKPIAAVILVIHLLISLVDAVSSDNFNSDKFIKLLLKLGMGSIFINNAFDWCLSLMQVGNSFLNTIASTLIFPDISTANLDEVIPKMDVLKQLGMIVVLILPALINLVLGIAALVIGWTRTIEMVLRAAFAPIGCADLFTGGANSSGFKYLKSMIAIALQGGIMVAIIGVSSTFLRNTVISTEFNPLDLTFYPKIFGITGAMVALCGSAKSLAKEIVGV